MAKKPNPNGANENVLDPRQKLCWENYISPKSETFGNAYQSAIKAEYEEYTAKVITTHKWFNEKLRRLNLLSKAEKKLDEILDIEIKDAKGDAGIMRIQADVAKFVASTQGKNDGYSTRTELTGAEGRDLGVVVLPKKDLPTDDEDTLETPEETSPSVSE